VLYSTGIYCHKSHANEALNNYSEIKIMALQSLKKGGNEAMKHLKRV
jgi:hypothetical protein